MNFIINSGLAALLLIAAVFAIFVAFEWLTQRKRETFCNIGEGRHDCSVSKLADAEITTRHLLYKAGSDADHVAVNGVNDVPLGVIGDEVATADLADSWLAVELLGKGSTKRMVASEAMATIGVPVFAAAAGKIALSGTVKVGTLLTVSGADGDVVEVQDCEPVVVGYQGGGGAVTQITSASTGVTLSKSSGQITTVALTTAAAAKEEFTVTNAKVRATDVIVLSTTYAGAGTPVLSVKGVAAGSFKVVVTNVHASAAFDAVMVINFAVIPAVAS